MSEPRRGGKASKVAKRASVTAANAPQDLGLESVQDLVSNLARYRFLAARTVLPLVDTPDIPPLRAYRRARRLAEVQTKATVEELYGLCGNDRLFGYVVSLTREAHRIGAEFQERLSSMKVGSAIVATHGAFAHDADRERLESAIKVQRVVSFRPTKEGDDDLRGVAVAAALKRYYATAAAIEAESPYAYALPEPPSELRLPTLDAARWAGLLAVLHDTEIAQARRLLIAAALGAAEDLPRLAWGDLTDQWKLWKAAKRAGVEISTSGTEEGTGDFEEGKRQFGLTHWGDLRVLPTSDEDGSPAALYEAREEAEKLLDHARVQWGARGEAFLGALLAGRSLVEASAAAGVSRQTGHGWREQLRSLALDPPEPKKT